MKKISIMVPCYNEEENVVPMSEALVKQLEEMKDSKLRLAAEYDNFRKRSQREKDSIYANEYVYGNQCVLFLCTEVTTFFNDKFYHINMAGLEEDALYKFEYEGKKKTLSGAYLMNVGLDFEMGGSLESKIIVFEKV